MRYNEDTILMDREDESTLIEEMREKWVL